MTMELDDRELKLDRMRYVKNTSSSRLCYLAILMDVLYFVSIYKSDVGSWYYQILIGASIVYNLLFLLMAFLASEGVKSYKPFYSKLLFGLGAGQIIRVFILPLMAHAATVKINGAETVVMENGQFIRVIVYLLGSAACLIASAVINQRKCSALAGHLKALEAKGAA
ncbi:MAG: hypothetical protein IJ246_04155 [Clostridia bacterium]|nr:hypothetical protein [Clostridia bacterium]